MTSTTFRRTASPTSPRGPASRTRNSGAGTDRANPPRAATAPRLPSAILKPAATRRRVGGLWPLPGPRIDASQLAAFPGSTGQPASPKKAATLTAPGAGPQLHDWHRCPFSHTFGGGPAHGRSWPLVRCCDAPRRQKRLAGTSGTLLTHRKPNLIRAHPASCRGAAPFAREMRPARKTAPSRTPDGRTVREPPVPPARREAALRTRR